MRPCSSVLVVVVWSVLATGMNSAEGVEYTKDSLNTIRQMVSQNKAMLVDVREKSEWDQGHLQHAVHVPLSALQAGIKSEELSKIIPQGSTVYCHCAAGGRTLPAADILIQYGYDVRPMKQGYADLLRAGFPPAAR